MISVTFTPEKWEAIRNTLELTEGSDYTPALSFAEIAQKVEDGEVNALKEYIELKRLSNSLSDALTVIQPLAIDEADKYKEKSFKAFGAIVEKKNAAGSWDYTGVAAWNAAKERLKWVEKMAQTGGAADSDSGEIIEKAVKIEGKSTIAIKLL